MQHILANLYTDPAYRETFFNDTSDPVAAKLKTLIPADVEALAGSLESKHFHEASSWLPLTKSILGEQAFALFKEFWRQRDRSIACQPRDNAKAFLNFLQERKSDFHPWLKDACRYELAWQSWHERPVIHILWLRNPVQEICRNQLPSLLPADSKRIYIACWFKPWFSNKNWHHVLRIF